MAQMTQEFIAKILATEVGVKCRWGCAETEGLRDRLEITGCFSKVAECPELEQEIVLKKEEVQESRAQDKFKGVQGTHLKVESHGLNSRTSRIAISLSLSVEKMTSEVRSKGGVQHGLHET